MYSPILVTKCVVRYSRVWKWKQITNCVNFCVHSRTCSLSQMRGEPQVIQMVIWFPINAIAVDMGWWSAMRICCSFDYESMAGEKGDKKQIIAAHLVTIYLFRQKPCSYGPASYTLPCMIMFRSPYRCFNTRIICLIKFLRSEDDIMFLITNPTALISLFVGPERARNANLTQPLSTILPGVFPLFFP